MKTIEYLFSLFLYLQISWRQRGLNWFIFYGPDNLLLDNLSFYGALVQIPVFIVLFVLPFVQMLYIVLRQVGNKKFFYGTYHLLRARGKLNSERNRDLHIRNAITIIVQV